MHECRSMKKLTAAIMCIILLILPLIPSTVGGSTASAAPANPWTDIGTGGDFGRVCAVTVDGKGTVYAADCQKKKVKMLQNGTWTDITGSENFLHPVGIATDSKGNVYVVDDTAEKIRKFSNGSWSDLDEWEAVTGLTNGTKYYFVVKAVKSGTDSEASNEMSATPFTVPSAPIHVAAVAGNGQATVTFEAPADNGGSGITRYEVTVTPGGNVVPGTSSPIVVTGLLNGTSYTFTVRAVNEAGRSDPSAESNPVVPSAPSSGGTTGPSQPASPTEPPETTAPEPENNNVMSWSMAKKKKRAQPPWPPETARPS